MIEKFLGFPVDNRCECITTRCSNGVTIVEVIQQGKSKADGGTGPGGT